MAKLPLLAFFGVLSKALGLGVASQVRNPPRIEDLFADDDFTLNGERANTQDLSFAAFGDVNGPTEDDLLRFEAAHRDGVGIVILSGRSEQFMTLSNDSVTIKRWSGRLGNNVIQYLHAVAVARRTNRSFVNTVKMNKHRGAVMKEIFPTLPVTQDVRRLYTEGEVWPPAGSSCLATGQWYFKGFCEHLTATEVHDILFRHLRPFMRPELLECAAVPLRKEEENTLTVHLRSGDIWNHQPPCSFYEKVYASGPFDHVRAIADVSVKEAEKNPCIDTLNATHPGSFDSGSLDSDGCALMRAANVVAGSSSFVAFWLRFNPNLKRVYGLGNSDVCGDCWWTLAGPSFPNADAFRYGLGGAPDRSCDSAMGNEEMDQQCRRWMLSYPADNIPESTSCPGGSDDVTENLNRKHKFCNLGDSAR